MLPASIGELVFQKSANLANVLVTVLLSVIFLFPKFLAFKGSQRIPHICGIRNKVRQNWQVQSHLHLKRARQHRNSQVNKTTWRSSILRCSCLSLEPDWHPSLPWASCYFHMTMLLTHQSSVYHTHTSILQMCFKNTCNTDFSVHLHLPAWLAVLLLLNTLFTYHSYSLLYHP